MRGWKGWTAYVFAVLGVELLLAYMAVAMAIESEYCDEIGSGWRCSDTLWDLVGVGFWAVPVVAIVAALIIIRYERTRH